ncbi:MAG: ATP-grasp domain-containing protein [Gemmataceae bacterium]|nr:ATP-grasp domain-containing protein [Gemmataceae bacterium]MCI0741878.1 ATP-grasp domain-containing protein [Gemmataceae bacterium]
MRLLLYEMASAGDLPNAPAALVAEGAAMLSALAEDLAQVSDVDVFTIPAASKRRSRLHDGIAQADAVLLIAPEFDNLLLDCVRLVENAGKQLFSPSSEAVRLTADKLALFKHWQALGVPTPAIIAACREFKVDPTLRVGIESKPSPESFPLVCKPRFGAGAQATILVERAEDYCRRVEQVATEWPGQEFLLQEYAPGQAASISFLVGPRQTLALPAGWQLQSSDGRFRYQGGSMPLAPALGLRAQRLGLRALEGIAGLCGFVGVDLVLGRAADGSDDRAIEINPRPTTSYLGLRQLAKENLAEAICRLVAGENNVELNWHQGPVTFQAKRDIQISNFEIRN